jgi:hypothetical protein
VISRAPTAGKSALTAGIAAITVGTSARSTRKMLLNGAKTDGKITKFNNCSASDGYR